LHKAISLLDFCASEMEVEKEDTLVEFLLKRNREQSAAYTSPDAILWRRQYRAKHPTEVAALKCMDGRINLSLITETPPGIVQSFSNIGGKFDLGWPYFGMLILEWVDFAVNRGRNAVYLVTYHFSKGNLHRGCKGFGYDTEAAKKGADTLRCELEVVFGSSHQIVYPITVGVETDSDALILHGAHGGVLDMFEAQNCTTDELSDRLLQLFPDMHERFVLDLVPLLLGNQRHIRSIAASSRTILDSEHREQILGVGRGFDWLHMPNKALIVGPYSYDLHTPIATAAAILLDNIHCARIAKEEGVVILISAAYRDARGPEPLMAKYKARSLAELAMAAIRQDVPDLLPYVTVLVGTVDFNTRAFVRLPELESHVAI
jgi:hypothetical protein